jgi:peptide/nickel transport system substrate-binding protein
MSISPRARRPLSVLVLSLSLLILAACGSAASQNTPTPALPTASPTPAGPQTLNICLGSEPSSLYLYGDNSESARAIRQAIYDGPIDSQGYAPQPVILESIPSLENGGAVVQAVAVSAGHQVVDADGAVSILQPGLRVRPAGCRDGNCVLIYEGGELHMDQVSATFTLRANITWSDGTLLTAADSVYSFTLNRDPATPGNKTKLDRAASYTASDERTVIWTGLPGYLDPGFQNNFWSPLPRHTMESIPAADLLASDAVNRAPLGWGPYTVSEWVPGERISLARNANYWRAAEELPYFQTVNFLFTGSAGLDAIRSGQCDLMLPSTGISAQAAELQQATDLLAYSHAASSWLHLDFGIRPTSHDDGFNVFADRADFFGEPRMRQAIAQCIDRVALSAQFGHGPASSFTPATHPSYNAAATGPAFDPASANATLDELGWFAADGIRVNGFYPGAQAGTLLHLRLHTSDADLAIAQAVQSQLSACGISLEITSGPAEEIFAPGPEGAVFGRNFDLALFAWPYDQQSACYLYLSEAIPGSDLAVNRYGWGGWNAAGWQNAEFDAACHTALNSLPGEPAHAQAEQQAQAIFADQVPTLPLFASGSFAAARAGFCGFSFDPGSHLLQSIESFGYAEHCQ